MSFWLSLVKTIAMAVLAWFRHDRSRKDIELGQMREQEKQQKHNEKLRNDIRNVDISGVSDDDLASDK